MNTVTAQHQDNRFIIVFERKGHKHNQGTAIPLHTGISSFYWQQTCGFVKQLSHVCMHQNCLVWCNMFSEKMEPSRDQQQHLTPTGL